MYSSMCVSEGPISSSEREQTRDRIFDKNTMSIGGALNITKSDIA